MLFWPHIEGMRVPIIIPHPKLLRLNITGAKSSIICFDPVNNYHAAEERGQIESFRMLFTDSGHEGVREDQSWHN